MLTALHFHPFITLKPPVSEMDPEVRLAYLRRHFYGDFGGRALPEGLRRLVQAMIRIAKQLTYVGYYSDPDCFESIGYVPYSRRPDHVDPVSERHPLLVQRPDEVVRTTVEADVCIMGSGAGGAVLAYHLAQTGAKVVVLERGQYVEPRHFNEDEVEMIGKLYGDGVFQQTRDYRFTILQGSCVGGSTVVNNAVSFRTPLPVLEAWNDPWRWNAGLDVHEFARSMDAIERWLPVQSQDRAKLNRSSEQFLRGVKALGLSAASWRWSRCGPTCAPMPPAPAWGAATATSAAATTASSPCWTRPCPGPSATSPASSTSTRTARCAASPPPGTTARAGPPRWRRACPTGGGSRCGPARWCCRPEPSPPAGSS